MRTTKKELINLAKNLKAINVNDLTHDEVNKIIKNEIKTTIAISCGTYGFSAVLVKVGNVYLYAPNRSCNAFLLL